MTFKASVSGDSSSALFMSEEVEVKLDRLELSCAHAPPTIATASKKKKKPVAMSDGIEVSLEVAFSLNSSFADHTTCSLHAASHWIIWYFVGGVQCVGARFLHKIGSCEEQPRVAIEIKLPNGTLFPGIAWETTPMVVAKSISQTLSQRVVIAKVRGILGSDGPTGGWRVVWFVAPVGVRLHSAAFGFWKWRGKAGFLAFECPCTWRGMWTPLRLPSVHRATSRRRILLRNGNGEVACNDNSHPATPTLDPWVPPTSNTWRCWEIKLQRRNRRSFAWWCRRWSCWRCSSTTPSNSS